MQLKVLRYNSQSDYTDGLLFQDKEFKTYTLEDEYRTVKKYGETRIPDGVYNLKLRTEGGFHNRYLKKFGADFHRGMLEIKDVPGFQYVLIHIGNDDDDTAGCLLVGSTADKDRGFIGGSKKAYMDIYPAIAAALIRCEPVSITFRTL